MHRISYGLYVVSSKKGEKVNGQIANTVFQATSEPVMIAACINKQNLTHEYIQESKVFTASILSKETPMKFIGNFGFKSGRELDKFKDVNYELGVTGAPVVLENTIGYLEAEVTDSLDVGVHTLFVGKVVEAKVTKEGEPMTYSYYHQVKRGKTPEAATTYIGDNSKKMKGGTMDKYQCTVCGYIYDPEEGDPDGGIDPSTPFEDIPDDWVCPVCGASKDQFEKME